MIGRSKVKRGGEVPTGIAFSVGGLTLINIAVAVFWSKRLACPLRREAALFDEWLSTSAVHLWTCLGSFRLNIDETVLIHV